MRLKRAFSFGGNGFDDGMMDNFQLLNRLLLNPNQFSLEDNTLCEVRIEADENTGS